ncbi:ABC transporter substrate-binding protein [Bordetella sputigena]|uniref:Bug family tripartite tricarboxylate transporter substrate binding protein n=1 Tax=Bordetella sputigena TaxID=1416810 RepID=UPI0039EE39B1
MHYSRRKFLGSMAATPLAAGSLLAAKRAGAAETYPSRPVKLLVPFSPGSSTDIAARTYAELMSKQLSAESVFVENRAGAGGTIGASVVARAANDGYNLLYSTATTWAIAPFVYPDLSYNPARDFTPIAVTIAIPTVLVVSGDSDIKDFKDLAARVKAHPEKYSYGSNGVGAHSHITSKLLANRMGAPNLLHVPFKQGSQGVMTEIMGGRLTFAVDAWSVVGPHIKSGRLRGLATIAKDRLAVAPDIPTASELLGQEFDTTTWNGLWAPAGISTDIVKRLHDAMAAGHDVPAMVTQFQNQGTPLMPRMSVEEVNVFMKEQIVRWKGFVKEADLTT